MINCIRFICELPEQCLPFCSHTYYFVYLISISYISNSIYLADRDDSDHYLNPKNIINKIIIKKF